MAFRMSCPNIFRYLDIGLITNLIIHYYYSEILYLWEEINKSFLIPVNNFLFN